MLKKNLANIITAIRIIGTIVLIFFPVPGMAFFTCYCLCGLSDVLDGFVARTLKIQSKFGSRMDSFADLFFYSVMLIKIFPRLMELLAPWIWVVISIICLIRIFDYAYTAAKFHHLAAMHTILNKVSGGMMFVVPFLLETGDIFLIYVYCMLAVTMTAAIQELILHIRLKSDMSSKA